MLTYHVIRIKIFDDSLSYEASVNVKMSKNSSFGSCLGKSSVKFICAIIVLLVFLGVCDANSYCKKHKAKQILKLPSKGMIAGKIFFYLNQSIFYQSYSVSIQIVIFIFQYQVERMKRMMIKVYQQIKLPGDLLSV